MNTRFDIIGLGCSAVDDVWYVERYPEADTKTPITKGERILGGLAARALLAAAELGGQCAYVATLGDGPLSTFVRSTLSDAGINVDYVDTVAGAGPIHSQVIVGREAATRNSFFDLSHWQGVPHNWPAEQLLPASSVLLIDNYCGAKVISDAVRNAQALRVPVVADLEGDIDPSTRRLADTIDHLIISRSFAHNLTGCAAPEEALNRLVGNKHRTVVVTDGAQGCWYTDGITSVKHQRSFPVLVHNTTGCGDVFHGAYALALARNVPLSERVIFASAAAAAWARGAPLSLASIESIQFQNWHIG